MADAPAAEAAPARKEPRSMLIAIVLVVALGIGWRRRISSSARRSAEGERAQRARTSKGKRGAEAARAVREARSAVRRELRSEGR